MYYYVTVTNWSILYIRNIYFFNLIIAGQYYKNDMTMSNVIIENKIIEKIKILTNLYNKKK